MHSGGACIEAALVSAMPDITSGRPIPPQCAAGSLIVAVRRQKAEPASGISCSYLLTKRVESPLRNLGKLLLVVQPTSETDIGYLRVSGTDQVLDLQRDAPAAAGCSRGLGGSGERCQEGPPRTPGPTRASSRRRHPSRVAPGQAWAIAESSDRDGRRPPGTRGGIQIAHGDDRYLFSRGDADLSNLRRASTIRKSVDSGADGRRTRCSTGQGEGRWAAQSNRRSEGPTHPTDDRGWDPEERNRLSSGDRPRDTVPTSLGDVAVRRSGGRFRESEPRKLSSTPGCSRVPFRRRRCHGS